MQALPSTGQTGGTKSKPVLTATGDRRGADKRPQHGMALVLSGGANIYRVVINSTDFCPAGLGAGKSETKPSAGSVSGERPFPGS